MAVSKSICYDVHTLDAFMKCVLQNCKGIEVIKVDETHVEYIESKIKNRNITPFRGTIKVHQVTWSHRKPWMMLQFRRLSCIKCSQENTCIHYGLGSKKLDIALCPRPLQNNVPTLSSPVLTTPLQSPTRNDTPAPAERMNSWSPTLTPMHTVQWQADDPVQLRVARCSNHWKLASAVHHCWLEVMSISAYNFRTYILTAQIRQRQNQRRHQSTFLWLNGLNASGLLTTKTYFDYRNELSFR